MSWGDKSAAHWKFLASGKNRRHAKFDINRVFNASIFFLHLQPKCRIKSDQYPGITRFYSETCIAINFIFLIVTFLKFSLKFNHSNFLPISLLKREKKLSIFGNNDYPYSDLKIYRRDTDSFPECSTYRKLLFLHSF